MDTTMPAMTQTTAAPTGASAGRNLGGKYLTFALGPEAYAVDVRKVQEIIRLTSITAVPQMPEFIRGVTVGSRRPAGRG